MFHHKKHIRIASWMVIPVIVLAVTSLGFRAVGSSMDARPPTVVVVFNLQKVFDNFIDRAVLGAGFKKLEEQINVERTRRKELVDSLMKSYEEAGDEDRDALFDQIQQAMGEAEKYVEFTEREKDLERSLIMQSLFRDIKEAVATIATANNYDLVIASDESMELSPELSSRATNEQVSMHRVYFANDQIDITEQIVTQMNLEKDADKSN